jgi:diamine N-acetyltransferase
MRLRKLEPYDLPFLYQWENDAQMWADADTHNPLSQQDLRDYVESTTGDIYKDGQLRLIIENEGVTMGCVDLFDFDPRNRKAAIGMYIAPEYRHQGIGAKALVLLEQYTFEFLQLRMLYAIIATTNEVCSRLYAHSGYQSSSPLKAWTLESDAIIWIKTNGI